MNENFGIWIIGFLLTALVLYVYLSVLFRLATSKNDRKDLFYLFLYLPYIVGLFALFFFAGFSGLGLAGYFWILLLLFALERTIWGVSLYQSAGNGQVAWFIMIYFFSPVLWIVYQVQKLG